MKEIEMKELYETHADIVYRYIFLLVRNKEVAEDLTQETFMKVLQHFHHFQHKSNVSTWIIKIAKNTTYDYFRKQRFPAIFKSNEGNSPSSEESLIQKTEIEMLYKALFRLKRDYQEVIILRKINEFSINETAHILGWSENKVKAKLARALQKLRTEMTRLEVGHYEQT